jgi:hypothetical protein
MKDWFKWPEMCVQMTDLTVGDLIEVLHTCFDPKLKCDLRALYIFPDKNSKFIFEGFKMKAFDGFIHPDEEMKNKLFGNHIHMTWEPVISQDDPTVLLRIFTI